MIVLAVVLLVAGTFYISQRSAKAQSQQYRTTTVPKSYGNVVGSVGEFLIFQASDGTIRLVSPKDGQITRMITRSNN